MTDWFAEAADDACPHFLDPSRCLECAQARSAAEAVEECAACGHQAPLSATAADVRINWEPTGRRVCKDPAACCARRLARDRELNPPAWLKARAAREAARQAAAPRYCGTCQAAGDDDSRLGTERAWNVEGAGPGGILADVCENGHVFAIENSDEEECDG